MQARRGTLATALVLLALLLPGLAVCADSINYGPTPFSVYPPKTVEAVPGRVMKIFFWEASAGPEGVEII